MVSLCARFAEKWTFLLVVDKEFSLNDLDSLILYTIYIMAPIQHLPYIILAAPKMMIFILFLFSPYIFILTTIAFIIKIYLVKVKKSDKDKRDMYHYAIMATVSGIMWIIVYLHAQKNPLIF